MTNLTPFRGIPFQPSPTLQTNNLNLPISMSFAPKRPNTDINMVTPVNQIPPVIVQQAGAAPFVNRNSGGITGIGIPTINTNPHGQFGYSPIRTSPINGIGTVGAGRIGGLVDADPITPGIQLQPGVLTPYGSSGLIPEARKSTAQQFNPFGARAVRGPVSPNQLESLIGGILLDTGLGLIGGGMINGTPGSLVDVDTINHEIPTQQGMMSSVGLHNILQGPNVLRSVNNSGNSEIAESDPFTPGLHGIPLGPQISINSGLRKSGSIIHAIPSVPSYETNSYNLVADPVVHISAQTPASNSGTIMNSSLTRNLNVTSLLEANPIPTNYPVQTLQNTVRGPNVQVTQNRYLPSYKVPGAKSPQTIYLAGSVVTPVRLPEFNYAGVPTVQRAPIVMVEQNWWNRCPWWLWLLLGLLIVTVIVGGLLAASLLSKKSKNQESQSHRKRFNNRKYRRVIRTVRSLPIQKMSSSSVHPETKVFSSVVVQTIQPVKQQIKQLKPELQKPQIKAETQPEIKPQTNSTTTPQIQSTILPSIQPQVQPTNQLPKTLDQSQKPEIKSPQTQKQQSNSQNVSELKQDQNKITTTTTVTKTIVKAESADTTPQKQIPNVVDFTIQQVQSKKAPQKVPIFSSTSQTEQGIGKNFKTPQLQTITPKTIVSTAVPTSPTSTIDAPKAQPLQSQSTNVISIPATITKKSIPPIITYSGTSFVSNDNPNNFIIKKPYTSRFIRTSTSNRDSEARHRHFANSY